MLRRAFLLTPLALAAQPGRRSAVLGFTRGATIPNDLAGESVLFGRAYLCCAQAALAREAAERGKFAHALGPDDAGVIDLLRTAGFSADEIDAGDPVPPGAIVVFVASGDGQDTPFERSIKVTVAIRAPMLAPRIANEFLLSTVDLAPTLLSLCGAAVPASMQGRDLSGLLLGRGGELPDSVYVQGTDWRAVIRGYDKLVFDLNGAPTHLYHLPDDPGESTDLVDDAASQLTRDALMALARVWMRRIGDGLDPSGLRKRQ